MIVGARCKACGRPEWKSDWGMLLFFHPLGRELVCGHCRWWVMREEIEHKARGWERLTARLAQGLPITCESRAMRIPLFVKPE